MSHQYDNRHYIIFDCTELGTIDFNQVEETSIDTVRKSLDESQTFVKYIFTTYLTGSDESPIEVDTIPSSVEALTTKSQPYSYNEILTILSGPDWTDPNPQF
jgi:hypothetical protein